MKDTWSRLQDEPVFLETDVALLALDRDLVIRAVNPAYEEATDRTRDELVGRGMFEAFPDNPDDPTADGVARLRASLELVLRESRRHRMALQRYDIPEDARQTSFVRKFWDPVNSPLHDDHGRVVGALHRVQDVTDVLDPILGNRPATALADGTTDDAWSRVVTALVDEILAHRETRARAEGLNRALSSRILVEQAKGALAARERCSPEEAFELLRGRSRSTNTPIRQVARAVIEETCGAGAPRSG